VALSQWNAGSGQAYNPIIGMLIIDKDIDTELFLRTVDTVVVRGKLIASDEIRDIIEKMN
jgi:hypothetical protein